ncbi:CPBP family intramembrane glutamic endopeptidase [Ruminiclostridium cellobioparum]|uniref:CPBP family intramembrane glutamic endopeptidase n=1 Tax=Ruminiclostridium cellobioparum TaxID=29355 RepID=UPI0004880479|nr:CPBP family intramembrane glutamic endopeptidase [Ruminiclostridium cellobioparum]
MLTLNGKRRILSIITAVLLGCVVMAYVDAVIRPDYAIKSGIKIVLFTGLPLIYSLFEKELELKNLLRVNGKSLGFAAALGAGVYIFILGAYYLLSSFLDFSKVTAALQNNVGVTRDNFIFVALYISFINSLLEEYFFRGVAFLWLKKAAGRKFAYIFSAAAFAAYHIAIMTSWFSPGLFVLLIAGLFGAGLLFNRLDEKYDNIYVSWLVHMFANFAINTIGFMLFGITL